MAETPAKQMVSELFCPPKRDPFRDHFWDPFDMSFFEEINHFFEDIREIMRN